jgi:hypothetical protein
MTELERIIRPIVEGQIRSFCHDHPSILNGVDWYSQREDKIETLVNSLSKRITRDLLCGSTTARMASALLALTDGGADEGADVAGFTASAGADLACSNGSAP